MSTGICLSELSSALCTALTDEDIPAVTAWSADPKPYYTEPVVCVGVKKLKFGPAGLGGYIGQTEEAELYGKRLDICFSLDIYSPAVPEYAGEGCADMLDQLVSALPEAAGGLFKMSSLSFGDTEFDSETGMFLIRSELECLSMAFSENSADGEFTDFTLSASLV